MFKDNKTSAVPPLYHKPNSIPTQWKRHNKLIKYTPTLQVYLFIKTLHQQTGPISAHVTEKSITVALIYPHN